MCIDMEALKINNSTSSTTHCRRANAEDVSATFVTHVKYIDKEVRLFYLSISDSYNNK